MPLDMDPGQDHDANLLAAFLENRLSPAERREMERHLAECRDCRETLALGGEQNWRQHHAAQEMHANGPSIS